MIKYLLLLILLCLSVDVFAQTDTLAVTENGIQQEIILSSSTSNLPIQERLKLYYSNSGFFEAEIIQEKEISIVNTGERYKIEELRFQQDDSTTFIDQNVTNKDYSRSFVEQRIRDYYSELVDEGFRNAEIEISAFKLDSLKNTVSIIAGVERGKPIQLSRIIFTGNKINSQDYLSKVSEFRDSLLASNQNLVQIRENLLRSELFEGVYEPNIFEDQGESVVVVAVEERTLNQLDGLIGYVPDAAGKGQIVGDLNISLWNVFKEGNAFELMYQRLRPETSRIQLGVSQNWIANIPLSIGLDFSLYQNDTTYQTRNIGLNSSYSVAPNFKINGRLFSMNSNSSKETGFLQEPDGSKQGADLGFTYSSLDRIEVPKSGIIFDVMYGIANKDIEADSALVFRQQQLEATLKTYFPLFKNSVIATSLHGFYVIGNQFTESDLIRFGGANSLRGYTEEQYTASELLWGDVEYRFLTDRNSYLFLFTAAGLYGRPRLYSEIDNTFTQSDFLYSGGFGLSYKTAIGRLKFSYALSSTETLGNGKVHFGISTSL